MLNLQSETSESWLRQVDEHLDEILIDHAHCERKAAGTAMNLMFAYLEKEELTRDLTEIVNEELEHYRPQDWNEIVVTVRDGVARATCNGEVLEEAIELPATQPARSTIS